MSRRRVRAAAAGGAVLLALLGRPGAVLADVGAGSSLTGPATAAPGQAITLQAQFVQSTGALLPAGVPVVFSQLGAPAPPCAARLDPPSTITDATGAASVQATLPAGCPGPFLLAATATGRGTVEATVTETGGFPNTSAPAPAPLPTAWLAALIATLAAAGAGSLATRRRV